jgi:hypothetical protein
MVRIGDRVVDLVIEGDGEVPGVDRLREDPVDRRGELFEVRGGCGGPGDIIECALKLLGLLALLDLPLKAIGVHPDVLVQMRILDHEGCLVGDRSVEVDLIRRILPRPAQGPQDEHADGATAHDDRQVEYGPKTTGLHDLAFFGREVFRRRIRNHDGLSVADASLNVRMSAQRGVAEDFGKVGREGRCRRTEEQLFPLDKINGARVERQQPRGCLYDRLEDSRQFQRSDEGLARLQKRRERTILLLD